MSFSRSAPRAETAAASLPKIYLTRSRPIAKSRFGRLNRSSAAVVTVFLLALPGGCAGTSGGNLAGNIWSATRSAVTTAVGVTSNALSGAVDWATRTNDPGAQKERPKPVAARVATRPDRFPSKREKVVEESIPGDDFQRVTKRQVRGKTPKELLLLPRGALTREEVRRRIAEIDAQKQKTANTRKRRSLDEERKRLARTLQLIEEENTIIQDMESLRTRLRRLQKRLQEVQRRKP